MSNYFECNLPKKAPYWLHKSVRPAFDEMLRTVKERMQRLNDAMDITGLDGATFSKFAKVLFDANEAAFDQKSADHIAAFVGLINDGSRAEPRMEWPNATVVVDTAFVTRKEWESLRHFGIGGSEAATILGCSPYVTPKELYHKKVGTPANKTDNSSQWVFDRGHIMEDRVIEAFCNMTGAKVIPETRMFASKKYPQCTANIDAIISFSDGRIAVFEAKTTIAGNIEAWAKDRIPLHYQPQMRQYPGVLDDDRIMGTYIGCLMTDDVVVKDYYVMSHVDAENKFFSRFLERDTAEEENQLMMESDWFDSHINACSEPAGSSDAAKDRTILNTYATPTNPKDPAKTFTPNDINPFIEEYLKYKDKADAAKKDMESYAAAADSFANDIIAMLDGNVSGTSDIGDGTRYEIKNSPRPKSKVDKDTLLKLIDASAAFLPPETRQAMRDCFTTEQDAYRVFSVKIKKLPRAI